MNILQIGCNHGQDHGQDHVLEYIQSQMDTN